MDDRWLNLGVPGRCVKTLQIRDLHPIRTHGKRKRQLDDVVRRNLYLVYLDLEHMVSTRCRFALAHFTSRLPAYRARLLRSLLG